MSYHRALTEFNRGNYKKAIEDFKIYLQKYPEDPDAFFHIGVSYLNLKDYQNSLLNLRKVIDLIPKDEDTWELLHKIYLELKDAGRAEQCKKRVLPKLPYEGYQPPKIKDLKKATIKNKIDLEVLKLPLVIIDDNLLLKIFEVKQQKIFYVFKQATELFNFITSEHMVENFKKQSNYLDEKFYTLLKILQVKPEDLKNFEKYLFEICPDSKRVKETHDKDKSWFGELTLPYIFLNQDAKNIIIVCEENTLQKVCKDLKFSCILMNAQKFWAYLRYKIKRHFPDFYDMWL